MTEAPSASDIEASAGPAVPPFVGGPDLRGRLGGAADVPAAPIRQTAWLSIGIALLLNALDGYDILAISFAAPGISSEWRIQPASMGVMLSMELIGMGVGSIVLGHAADRFGRRPVVLGCFAAMAAGMLGAAASAGLPSLFASRLSTGVGIGGMLATLNALVAESASNQAKAFSVALMSSGFSIGGLAGGAIAAGLLAHHGWRSAFVVGAVGTLLMLPATWRFLPESASYPAGKGVTGTADSGAGQARRILSGAAGAPSAQAKLGPGRLRTGFTALVLTSSYFLNAFSFYFVLKWMPKLVVSLGHSPAEAGRLLVLANAGGVVGALGFGALSLRINTRALLLFSLPVMFGLVASFGLSRGWPALVVGAALMGCMGNASVTGFYALCARCFPTALRGAGTGLVIGIGRGGAVLGPIAAGLLVGSGLSFGDVFLAMGTGSLLSAAVLL